MKAMIDTLKDLRVTVRLRVPQKDYALVSELMEEGRVIHRDYEGNDVLLEVEIPTYLKHKVEPFVEK